MKWLRKILDSQQEHFVKGGKLEKLFPLYEAIDTFLYTPSRVAKGSVHVRDGIDLKRAMMTVVMALLPVIGWSFFNTGYQALLALESMNSSAGQGLLNGWRGEVLAALGLAMDSSSILSCVVLGSLYFIPIYLVTNVVGGFWEAVFASVRKHEINEGFLVTGILFPLILPPLIPLWQVALGISFGVVIGKEIFGGTGKNFLNPALTARAFLFFSYPAQISGDAVWVAVDGYSGPTILGIVSQSGMHAVQETYSWWQSFIGLIPGSMGETSTLFCLFGAVILIATGIGSWRIMASMLVSGLVFATLFNLIGSDTNPMFSMPPWWHVVTGGFAFGCVFMATDPVSGSMTLKGQYYYGALIGFVALLVRVINPAFPEGVMLAILFANVCAPMIDHFVVQSNIKKRNLRYGCTVETAESK